MKTYRNYEVKFAGHAARLCRASSPERAIAHTMEGINSSLSRIYSGQPAVGLSEFEYLVDSPRYNKQPVAQPTEQLMYAPLYPAWS